MGIFLLNTHFYLLEVWIINTSINDSKQKRTNSGRETRELVNERITFKEVLLIDSDGTKVGVVPIQEAQQRSMDQNMDLYCVSPQANPPVCKILDYGKYKFEQAKREKEAKKNEKRTIIKEIRFTATTDKHDLQIKANAATKFLNAGMKVKVSVFVKGRMFQRMDIVEQTLKTFLDMIKDVSDVEKLPEMNGRDYSCMVNPKKIRRNQDAKNEK